jgi:hypothetical protein
MQPPQDHFIAAATSRVRRSILWPAVILVVSIIAWFMVTSQKTPSPDIPTPTHFSFNRRAAFYHSEITPLIRTNTQANHEAAQRCLARIDDAFARYRQGIKSFSEDITSMGARFGILVRLPSDWWYDDGRLEQYVQDKFETHLFSEAQLNNALTHALTIFRDDLQANRNQLLALTKVAIQDSDFPGLSVPDDHSFDSTVNRQFVEFATGRAQDSVYHGIATFIASEVAVVAGTQLLTRVVTSIGTGTATSVAAGGGAAASGAAAGAGAGTMAGPLGTAIGVGVGIVVGVMVDWWMTEQFQAELENDLQQYLTKLRNGMIEGVNGQPGLRQFLSTFNDDLSQAHRATMYHRLVGEYS